MSSMRNAVQRRNHRERAQPHDRAKWGVLEKHKDYSLRAASHAAKKTHLRALRQKAASRNPDEFYFGMVSAPRSETRAALRGNSVLGQDAVRLLKTQDAGYLRVVGAKARKEVAELERRVKMLDVSRGGAGEDLEEDEEGERREKSGEHIVFVDRPEEQRAYRRPTQGGGLADGEAEGEDGDDDDNDGGEEETCEQHGARLRARLANLRARLEQIDGAARELEVQRARMGKSAAVGGGVNKEGVRWKGRGRTGR